MTTIRSCVIPIVAGLALTGVAWTPSVTDSAKAATQSSQRQIARNGTATFDFDPDALAALGFRFIASSQVDDAPTEHRVVFGVAPASTLEMETQDGGYTRILGGSLQTYGALLLDKPGDRVVIGNLALRPDADGVLTVVSTLDEREGFSPAFELTSVMIDFHKAAQDLLLMGELAISDAWALALDIPNAAGTAIGTVVIEASLGVVDEKASPTCRAGVALEESGRAAPEIAGADVLVADLQSVRTYGEFNGITGYAIGTNACNIGTARASWVAITNRHPLIVQNLYRLMDNRFEQIGMSWVKHGFYAISGSLCGPCNDPVEGGQALGVGCSDPYSATLNGAQTNMSPRGLVNAHTGYFPFPWHGDAPATIIDRRLQVHNEDLNPALNPQARYFMQGHYVHPDDCDAGTNNNNASYREVSVERNVTTGFWTLVVHQSWPTQRGQPAVRAWQDVDESVVETDIQLPDDGLFILAARTTDFGTGVWHYEYALQNLNSDRSCGSFSIPLPANAVLTNIGFHDVAYHSGETIDSTDWPEVVADGAISWATESYELNQNANALRWGTVYNFRFDVNAPPVTTTAAIGLFKPGSPEAATAETVGPALSLIDCNGNGIVDTCDVSCEADGCSTPCGSSLDCDRNSVPDECETDCNFNDIPDVCEVRERGSDDCNENGVPDECEPNEDCNLNGAQDICDIAAEISADCNENLIPDECERNEDCNNNGIQDICDIFAGTSQDCNGDNIPDSCTPYEDCNRNGVRDICDLAAGDSLDCNNNEIPDECEVDEDCNTNDTQDICDIASGVSTDCNANNTPDECEPYEDCNLNDVQDICDISIGISSDCNANSIPDDCEPYEDCNDNGLQDFCELASGAGADCNLNGALDSCDVEFENSPDCNADGKPDECEIDENSPAPGGPWFCTQGCDPDCNDNGVPDECEILGDADNDGLRDCEDMCPTTNPPVICVCPAMQDCCFPNLGFCYSDIGLPPIRYQECINIGGVPGCVPSPLCRTGCLVGDFNNTGDIDLHDVIGMQECFGVDPQAANSAECLRIFDFDDNGVIDLGDFQAFQGLYYNGPS